jgi:hypothetical protein
VYHQVVAQDGGKQTQKMVPCDTPNAHLAWELKTREEPRKFGAKIDNGGPVGVAAVAHRAGISDSAANKSSAVVVRNGPDDTLLNASAVGSPNATANVSSHDKLDKHADADGRIRRGRRGDGVYLHGNASKQRHRQWPAGLKKDEDNQKSKGGVRGVVANAEQQQHGANNTNVVRKRIRKAAASSIP